MVGRCDLAVANPGKFLPLIMLRIEVRGWALPTMFLVLFYKFLGAVARDSGVDLVVEGDRFGSRPVKFLNII